MKESLNEEACIGYFGIRDIGEEACIGYLYFGIRDIGL